MIKKRKERDCEPEGGVADEKFTSGGRVGTKKNESEDEEAKEKRGNISRTIVAIRGMR